MSWVGKSPRRKEDNRLVRGRGLFTDDDQTPGMLHMYVLRSPYAHANILSIDVSAAEAYPGVVCTLTGKEVAEQCDPYMELAPGKAAGILDYSIAVDRARHQGEPVAAVFAKTPAIAMDAGELIEVDYEMLDPVLSGEQGLEDKEIVHEAAGTNLVWQDVYEYGDVDKAFDDAAHIVKIDRLHFHRFSSTPLEGNACVAEWTQQGTIEFFCNNSFAGFAQQLLSPALRVGSEQIRIRTHDIGGSFGNKIWNYIYMTIAALGSRKAGGRKVKWSEIRNEHMLASGHGNERTFLDTEWHWTRMA